MDMNKEAAVIHLMRINNMTRAQAEREFNRQNTNKDPNRKKSDQFKEELELIKERIGG